MVYKNDFNESITTRADNIKYINNEELYNVWFPLRKKTNIVIYK